MSGSPILNRARRRAVVRTATFFVAAGFVLAGAVASAQEPGLRAAAQQARGDLAGVIDSRLVVLAEQEALRTSSPVRLAVANAERAVTDTSAVQRNAAGDVGVRITSDKPALLVDALEALGATKITVVPNAYLLECFVPANRIADLGGLVDAGLGSASAILNPVTMTGSVNSEADIAMQAQRVRLSTPGYNGSGVRIGCLSDSFGAIPGGVAAGEASGDLPTAPSVTVLEDIVGGSDEGRAMIELMYDLAPGSTYAFATAFSGGEAGFANNVARLANPLDGNCDVVVDDVAYFSEPYYQNSLVGQAINTAVSNHDIVYFTSAGNQSTNAYERVGPTVGADTNFAGSWIDFDPGVGVDTRQRFVVPNGGVIQLSFQWDDPFYTASGVDTDLDIYLVNSTAPTTVIAGSANDNFVTDQPFENFAYQNTSGGTQNLDLLINLFAGPVPGRIKYINYGNVQPSEFATNSPTVVSHAAAERGCGVGAINYFDQLGFASFTSVGPSTILFNDNGTLKGVADVRQTPLISAIQANNNTFFGNDAEGDGLPNFSGTSAAAPNAAAIAALVRQRNPGFNRNAVINALVAACDGTPGTPGYDNITGHGTLNGYKAVFGDPVKATPPVTEGAESGALPIAFTQRSAGAGRIQVTNANGPAVGSRHITMDTFFGSADVLNTVDMHLNLTGFSNVQLSFRQREFGDEDNVMPATFVTTSNTDGVAYSVDGGTNWKRIVSLTGTASSSTYTLNTFNLSTLATTNGDVLGSDVRIRFQQFDGFPIASDGMAFDDIQVTGTPAGLNGDANNDGTRNAADVTAIYNVVNGIVAGPLPGDGDVDNNAVVNNADATALINFLVNGTPIP